MKMGKGQRDRGKCLSTNDQWGGEEIRDWLLEISYWVLGTINHPTINHSSSLIPYSTFDLTAESGYKFAFRLR